MQWCKVLANWENGIVLKYPKQIKGRFQWNTSVLKNEGKAKYKQRFKSNDNLPATQNSKVFQQYIEKSTNKYVTSFPNLNGDTILVIPMPVSGKNYATLKDFIDNASMIQQQQFWKEVARVAKIYVNGGNNAWISVNGIGVPYTHVRICMYPKYYFDEKLKQE